MVLELLRRSKSAEDWCLWRDVAKFYTHVKFVMDTWMVRRYGASPALLRNPLATLEPMRRGLVQGTPRGVSGSRATMHLQERTVPWATVSDGFSGDTSR